MRKLSARHTICALMVGAGGAKLKPVQAKPDDKSPKALGPDGSCRTKNIIYCAILHGDTFAQPFSAFVTNSGPSFVWQVAQALGTFSVSVVAGVMNLNVWALTLISAIVCSIFGMWQLM